MKYLMKYAFYFWMYATAVAEIVNYEDHTGWQMVLIVVLLMLPLALEDVIHAEKEN